MLPMETPPAITGPTIGVILLPPPLLKDRTEWRSVLLDPPTPALLTDERRGERSREGLIRCVNCKR